MVQRERKALVAHGDPSEKKEEFSFHLSDQEAFKSDLRIPPSSMHRTEEGRNRGRGETSPGSLDLSFYGGGATSNFK